MTISKKERYRDVRNGREMVTEGTGKNKPRANTAVKPGRNGTETLRSGNDVVTEMTAKLQPNSSPLTQKRISPQWLCATTIFEILSNQYLIKKQKI